MQSTHMSWPPWMSSAIAASEVIEGVTLEYRPPSGARASDVYRRWDRDNTSRTGRYEPTSYTVGT